MSLEILNIYNYKVTIYSFPYIVIGLFILSLGLWVLTRSITKRVHISFFLVSLSMALILLGNGISFSSNINKLGFFWQKVCWLGVIILGPSGYFFTNSILEKQKDLEAISVCIIFLPFIVALHFNLLISDVKRYYWGYEAVGGKYETVFLLLFAFIIFYIFLLYINALFNRNLNEIKRKVIRMLLISFIVATFAAFDFLPLFGVKYYPLGFIPFGIFVIIISYVINRYKIFHVTPEIATNILVKTIPDILFYGNEEGKITVSNDASSKAIGLPIKKIIGKHVWEFLPITKDLIRNAKNKKYSEYKVLSESSKLNTHSGEKISVLFSFVEIENYEGDMVGFIVVCHDISKIEKIRKEREEALKIANQKEKELTEQLIENEKTRKAMLNVMEDLHIEKQKLLEINAKDEAVLLAIGDGLIVTDNNGLITMVNLAFEKMLGWKASEVLRKDYTKIVPMIDEKGNIVSKEERLRHLTLIPGKEIKETKTKYYSMIESYYYVRKDKTKFPVVITSTPIILGNKIIGAVEVFRDVTREREIDKAKSEFVSLASHQLRTPLATVNWYSEVLFSERLGKLNSKQKQYMKEIVNGNARMIRLVNALLNVSRIELGTMEIRPQLTNMKGVVQNIIKSYYQKYKSKNIVLKESYEKSLPMIKTDPNLASIVVENLISNAIKYTPSGGNITVEVRKGKDKRYLDVIVEDNGYGIPEKQQKQIFTKLFRADNIKSKVTDGTGLGLYIVKSIMDKIEGKINFVSKENVGSKFIASFPMSGVKKISGEKPLLRI